VSTARRESQTEPDQQGGGECLGRRHVASVRGDRKVREDEHQSHVADLTVKLQQRVLTERHRHRPQASHERELQAIIASPVNPSATEKFVQNS
jgi:hypothetical protein